MWNSSLVWICPRTVARALDYRRYLFQPKAFSYFCQHDWNIVDKVVKPQLKHKYILLMCLFADDSLFNKHVWGLY